MVNTTEFMPLALPVDRATLVRLQGRACIVCGDAEGPLLAVGHVETTSGDGAVLPWAVVACAEHRGSAS
ncbi:hypothetical protein GXW83_32325 [Streptacidiphilus sp. PB12-B1b]|uniref:hypothetical protein n=1 Tax=Streptacidiphilus sp. PB12-B1b TaxID=2705012 RepID=UPI0015FC1903|nr:hypothetical protein [Streptacidiphilus sp. PB12-B1b]QMU79696.1 hypothetical protein GXW83_32325 [Streptacidiphilus sp. PB12-B1b]